MLSAQYFISINAASFLYDRPLVAGPVLARDYSGTRSSGANHVDLQQPIGPVNVIGNSVIVTMIESFGFGPAPNLISYDATGAPILDLTGQAVPAFANVPLAVFP